MVNNYLKFPEKETIISWIMAICDKGYRRPGTSASHKVEQFLIEELKSFGFKTVEKQVININVWEPMKWQFSFKINNEIHEIPCFYACYTTFTNPDGVTGELIYLGEGKEEDFQGKDINGKIVICDLKFYELIYEALATICYYVHNPNNEIFKEHNIPDMSRCLNWAAYHRAEKKGAIGFVGILSNYPLDSPILYHPAEGIDDLPRSIPGIFLGKEDGKRLKETLKNNQNKSIEGNLILTGKETPGKTSNIIGILPGMSNEIIELGSHHDAAFHNAVQDASGVSIILALAKYFSQIPIEQRNKSILVLFSTCHFYGSIGGYEFIKKYKKLIPRIVASIHVEHIALEGLIREGTIAVSNKPQIRGLYVSDIPALKKIAKDVIIEHNLELTGIMPIAKNVKAQEGSSSKYSEEMSLWTDATPFHEIGIPIFSFISGPFYNWHPLDTLDKVAINQLEPVSKAFIDIVRKIDALSKEELSKSV
jgi:hypothetical protein